MGNQPRIFIGGGVVLSGMGRDPFESVPAIVVTHRERVLRGEPVLHGNHYDVGLGNEDVEVAVVELGESGFEEESTTVKVDQDGELLRMVLESGWG